MSALPTWTQVIIKTYHKYAKHHKYKIQCPITRKVSDAPVDVADLKNSTPKRGIWQSQENQVARTLMR
jgi:hypothetical protein